MSEYWTFEELANGEAHRHRVKERVYVDRGAHHTLEVLDTVSYGRGLFLDGRVQHLETDEYIYSETIIHPAVTLLGSPSIDVLVVGGGPGGAIRELLKHDSVAHVTQVEIDAGIIALTKQYFQHISCGYHDDPRVEIVIDDIQNFVRETGKTFDLIVYDVSEPLESSPASNLFSDLSLNNMRSLLTPEGAFVTWGGSIGPKSSDLAATIFSTVERTFPFTNALICHPQSYGTSWLTVIGSMQDLSPLSRTSTSINRYLDTHVHGELRLYDGHTHQHMFHIPKDVRAALNQTSRSPKIPTLKLGSSHIAMEAME